jgi:hypothetical protein
LLLCFLFCFCFALALLVLGFVALFFCCVFCFFALRVH